MPIIDQFYRALRLVLELPSSLRLATVTIDEGRRQKKYETYQRLRAAEVLAKFEAPARKSPLKHWTRSPWLSRITCAAKMQAKDRLFKRLGEHRTLAGRRSPHATLTVEAHVYGAMGGMN